VLRAARGGCSCVDLLQIDTLLSLQPDRNKLASRLAALLAGVDSLQLNGESRVPISRWRADARAAAFHLSDPHGRPLLVALVGGTGTGKSTVLNRLLGQSVSASSFKRTFTAGGVAIVSAESQIPEQWLDLPVLESAESPARGQPEALTRVTLDHPLTRKLVLIDTPDLDGDKAEHHAQADRIFRWVDAVVFLVTPEKYQMTELLPYYRLAHRYQIQSIFVMNKCEQPEALEDYAQMLTDQQHSGATIHAIPRDDSAYHPPAGKDLGALRDTLHNLRHIDPSLGAEGSAGRVADLVDRFKDQILTPIRKRRRDCDELIATLRAMESTAPGVDVNPITQQLQRRLQQRSVLYLMGPGRILDRVRQAPSLVARLPRTTWDLISGKAPKNVDPPTSADTSVPDFAATLTDQFRVLQSRIDDALQSHRASATWLAAGALPEHRIDPSSAGMIADEELQDLRAWLENKWNATPRDTMLLMKLLKHVPGGASLTKWSESAPYLLAIVVATHHAFFGHIDLIILGGYSLVTWLTQRASDEVAGQVRRTNRIIQDRFTRLAHEQIEQTCAAIDRSTPTTKSLDEVEHKAHALAEAL